MTKSVDTLEINSENLKEEISHTGRTTLKSLEKEFRHFVSEVNKQLAIGERFPSGTLCSLNSEHISLPVVTVVGPSPTGVGSFVVYHPTMGLKEFHGTYLEKLF